MKKLAVGAALTLLSLIGWFYLAAAQQVLPPGPPISGAVVCAYNTSPPTVTTGQWVLVQCDSTGKLITSGSAAVPLPLPTAGIDASHRYKSPSPEDCHVMKASQGVPLWYFVTTGATAGYIMVFNLASAPGNGPVVPEQVAIPIGTNTAVGRVFTPPDIVNFDTGFTVCFSSTGPFILTKSPTAQHEAAWQ